jgi:hypothetical protein
MSSQRSRLAKSSSSNSSFVKINSVEHRDIENQSQFQEDSRFSEKSVLKMARSLSQSDFHPQHELESNKHSMILNAI